MQLAAVHSYVPNDPFCITVQLVIEESDAPSLLPAIKQLFAAQK
jgi:hypothetical protein